MRLGCSIGRYGGQSPPRNPFSLPRVAVTNEHERVAFNQRYLFSRRSSCPSSPQYSMPKAADGLCYNGRAVAYTGGPTTAMSSIRTPLAAEAPAEPWRRRLLIFAIYQLLGIIFTWPLVLHLDRGAIQVGALPVDSGQNIWNLWWIGTALRKGFSPYVSSYLFYPDLVNFFYQPLSLPNALLVWPILNQPVLAFNTLMLLSFGLGGYWAYRLAYAVSGRWSSALLAGFVFVCTPYHLEQIWVGAMERAATFWLPLYLLLLMRALARRTPVTVLIAGLVLLLTTLASQYHGLYAAIYSAIHITLAALIAPRGARLRSLATGVGVGLVWLGLLLPLTLSAGGLRGLALEDWYARQLFHSVALVDLIAPNHFHPIWGDAVAAWHGALHPFGPETGAGLGLGVAMLIGVALWRKWAQAWPWAILALFCLLMAMGPQLRLTAAASPLPGPFLLLSLSEIFRNSSRPVLFVALMLLPVAVLVALGLKGLQDGGSAQWQGSTLLRSFGARTLSSIARPTTWIVALLLFESLVRPWPIMALRVDPAVQALNNDPLPGTILELPPRLDDSRSLLNQICHGRPILGGYLARLPDYPLVRSPSAIQALWWAEPPHPDIMPLNAAAELSARGVRFVLLDRTELPRSDYAHLRHWLEVPGVSLVHTSATRVIYQVEPMSQPTITLGSGWYDVEQSAARHWRWMQGRAELNLLAREQSLVTLSLWATAYGSARPLELWSSGSMLTRIEIPGAPRDRTIVLRLLLDPGQTTLTLVSPTELSPEGRQLSLALSDLQLSSLPTAASWVGDHALSIPPTLPAMTAAPCSNADR